MDPKTRELLNSLKQAPIAPAAQPAPEWQPGGVISEEAFAPPKPPKRAAPPKAIVAPASAKPAEPKRSAASAEPVTPPVLAATPKPQMDPDLLEDLTPVLGEYYKRAQRAVDVDQALDLAKDLTKADPARVKKLAAIQGIDLEDMAKQARSGMPFEDYKRAKEGAIGFQAPEAREAEFNRVVGDYEKAQKGEATSERRDIAPATESPAWTPLTKGYIVGNTAADEVVETAKPGEHQYAIAEELFKVLAKDAEWSRIYDLYGRQTTGGATLQYINDRAQQIMKNRGVFLGSPNADAEADRARRQATNEVLAMKTIGMWTPGIFLNDVQATEGAKTPGLLAAFGPNVELVGFNNRGMAVYRQESPLGTGLRAIDTIGVVPFLKLKGVPVPIPGQAPIVGLLTKKENESFTEAAARGIQTGANWLEYALEESQGSSTPARIAAGALGLAGAVAHPDAFAALGAASKSARAGINAYTARKIFKEAEPHLAAIVKAYKANDFEAAKVAEEALRDVTSLKKGGQGVIHQYQRGDAAVIEMLRAFDPTVNSLNTDLLYDLIAVGVRESPELAEALYDVAGKGQGYLHFSARAPMLSAKSEQGIKTTRTLETFLNAGNFKQHLADIQKARDIYLKTVPKTSDIAKNGLIDAAIARARTNAEEAWKAGAVASVDDSFDGRVAKLLQDNRAAILADPEAWLSREGKLRDLLRNDPITGADSAIQLRAQFYKDVTPWMRRRMVYLTENPMQDTIARDMKVFDRMEHAVRENIRSRIFAAEALRRELGAKSNIRVTPIDLADEIQRGVSAGGQPLSPYAEMYFKRAVRDLPEDSKLPEGSKRADIFKAIQNLDIALSATANRNRRTLAEQYREYFRLRVEEAAEGRAGVLAPPMPDEVVTPSASEAIAEAARKADNPAEAAKEDAAVEAAAKKAPVAGKAHPDAAELITKLAADSGVTTAEATRTLNALERVKPGDEFTKKLIVPGVSQERFVALRDGLEKMGKLAVLEDGKFVKATPPKAPEVKVAPAAPAAPAAASVTTVAPVPESPGRILARMRAEVAARGAQARAEAQAADRARQAEALRAKQEFEAGLAAAARPTTKPAAKPAATPAPAAVAPPTTLPRDLAGATPRYNIGRNVFMPEFESDIDKALFIVARPTKSTRHDDYMAFLRAATGLGDDAILAEAGKVTEQLKTLLKTSEPGAVDVPVIFEKAAEAVPAAKPTVPEARTPGIDRLEGYISTRLPDGSLAFGRPVAGKLIDAVAYPPGTDLADGLARFIAEKTRTGFWPNLASKVELGRGATLEPVDLDALDRIAKSAPSAPEAAPAAKVAEAEPPLSEVVGEPPRELRPETVEKVRDQVAQVNEIDAKLDELAEARREQFDGFYGGDADTKAKATQALEDIGGAQAALERERNAIVDEVERIVEESETAADAAEAAKVAEEAAGEAPVAEKAAEEAAPVARKAKGFNDKNSLNAGVYEVEVGGQTRRFFRDTKEGPLGAVWVEDTAGTAGMPITFLGNTKDDAVKALQRKYAAEAPTAEKAVEEAAAPATPSGITAVEEAPAVAEKIAEAAPTEASLRSTVDRLKAQVGEDLVKKNAKKDSFDVQIGDQTVSVRRNADGEWFDTNRNVFLTDNTKQVMEELRTAYVLAPLARAESQLAKLTRTAAPVEMMADFTRRLADASGEALDDLVSEITASTLADPDKRRLLETLRTKTASGSPSSVAIARELRALSPAAVEAAEPVVAAGAKTPEALLNEVKSLTHSMPGERNSVVLGTVVGDTFTPKYVIAVDSVGKPSRMAEVIAAQATENITDIPAAMKVEDAAELTPFSPRLVTKQLDKMHAEGDLFQMGYTGMGTEQVAKGAFSFDPDTGVGLVTLFSGRFDPSTITHELGHYIRRTALNADEMEAITKYVKSKGIQVEHKFGDFVGTAEEVEKAEEAFAEAYEVYLATGRAPTTQLKGLFEKIKEVFAALYRSARNGASGQDIPEEVRRVFDQLYSDVPTTPIESTFDMVYREGLGKSLVQQTGALDVLAVEAARRGIPKSTAEELNKRVVEFLKANPGATSNTKTALSFPVPIFGKSNWTGADLRALQQTIDLRATERNLAPLKMALFGDQAETQATEQIYRAIEGISEDSDLKTVGKSVLTAVVKSQIGGDVVKERGLRDLPAVMRQNILTGARLIEQGLGDTISVVNETIITRDRSLVERFLAGEEKLTFRTGRRIASSGQQLTAGFLRLFENAYKALNEDEKAVLQEFAAALNKRGTLPSKALAELPYPDFKEIMDEALKAAKKAKTDVDAKIIMDTAREKLKLMRESYQNKLIGDNGALPKFLNLIGSGDGQVGPQLSKALSGMYSKPGDLTFNEYRFAETLLFLTGSTPRNGALMALETQDDMLEATVTLLDEAQAIFGKDNTAKGEEFARRLAILVGTYGTVSTAKSQYQALGVILRTEEVTALRYWFEGYGVTPEMRARLDTLNRKFGVNTQFVPDTILGADVYVPAAARQIIADALAKAQFSDSKLTKVGDLYQAAFSFTKKRMTRGNFILRQRYYNVNTVDHFHQLALKMGYGTALASATRTAFQTLLTNPFFGQPLETAIRLGAGVTGNKQWLRAMEALRDGIQRIGADNAAQLIGGWFGNSKYQLSVNKVLEGGDELIVIGGRATSYAEIKRTFIAEGVFSSFDTRQLGSTIRREGSMFMSSGDTITSAEGASGPLKTAWAKLKDGINYFGSEVVDDLGDSWAERERIGAAITIMETGADARTASRLVIDGLYDYAQSMTKADRSNLIGLLFPFWTFQKNANQQFVNTLFSAKGAYRMAVLTKFRARATQLVAEIYYDEVGGELGIDVKSMPEDMQDYYYSVMDKAHEVYGPNLPTDVAMALRMIMTGRSSEVVDGKYVELDEELMRRMQAGAYFPGAAMQAYAMPLKGKQGLPTYVRDRPGVMIVQRRNAVVRHFMALRGQSDDYFYLMLPESSVESAMKHTSTSFAALLNLAGQFSRMVPGAKNLVDTEAAGVEGVNFLTAIQPIIDLERSPVAGPLINLYVQDRGYPKRLDPVVAAFMQKTMNMEILQVPADNDPFSGQTMVTVGDVGENGEPADFVSVMGDDYIKRVQEMNKTDINLDDVETVRERRYYLAPGAYSIAFENTPGLGEFNQTLLSFSQRPQEEQDTMGKLMYALRAYTGFDVAEVSPSKTAVREEPVTYQKTKKPF